MRLSDIYNETSHRVENIHSIIHSLPVSVVC